MCCSVACPQEGDSGAGSRLLQQGHCCHAAAGGPDVRHTLLCKPTPRAILAGQDAPCCHLMSCWLARSAEPLHGTLTCNAAHPQGLTGPGMGT